MIGLIVVTTIRPGVGNSAASESSPRETSIPRNVTTIDNFMDLFRNLFPPNLVEACIMQTVTILEYPGNDTIPKEEWPFKSVKGGNMNILGRLEMFTYTLAYNHLVNNILHRFNGFQLSIWASNFNEWR